MTTQHAQRKMSPGEFTRWEHQRNVAYHAKIAAKKAARAEAAARRNERVRNASMARKTWWVFVTLVVSIPLSLIAGAIAACLAGFVVAMAISANGDLCHRASECPAIKADAPELSETVVPWVALPVGLVVTAAGIVGAVAGCLDDCRKAPR